MGQEIGRSSFSPQDFRDFSARLHANLKALRTILDSDTFGKSPDTLGAELEFYMVDSHGDPLTKNREILALASDPGLTLELNRYNLEYNFPVYSLKNAPFSALESDIQATQLRLDNLAGHFDGNVVAIGILPTLTERFLGPEVMTDETRYKALSDVLIRMRGGAFDLDIQGIDHLQLTRDDITAEGICTSFQVHFCSDITDFVDTWNAMALVTPLVLALSANSPLLFGKRLWHESRVPLFKQATDSRRHGAPWHDLPRVDITRDWLRKSAYELFAQRVYLYPPLIPLCSDEDPADVLSRGHLPRLDELNLHNGTVWHWNRPIYCHQGEGHIRIELRSLPAGPSAIDMAANAAFHIGLAVGLREQMDLLIPAMPFKYVAKNFMTAARDGMNAKLIWPSLHQNRLSDKSVRALGLSLIDTARSGLKNLGVDELEADKMMSVIENRLESGQNGAVWQLDSYESLSSRVESNRALQKVLATYMQHSRANRPVSKWPGVVYE